MELKKVIVVLYGKEKHELIASGIKSHISSFNKGIDIITIDDEAITPNYSAVFKRKFYTFCQRNATWAYGIYSSVNERNSLKFFYRQKKKYDFKEKTGAKAEKLKERISYVKNVMLRFDPYSVVCMTPRALKLALIVRDMYKIETSIVAFMTDFGVDLRFLDVRCDQYLVANAEVKNKIMKYGIKEDKIVITGVPYAEKIKEPSNKEKFRLEFNIDNDHPLVVLRGGKYGSMQIIDDFNRIAESICQFNFIALTGSNKKLGALMRAIKITDNSKNIQIIDKADMKKLLTAADIFVTLPTTEDVLNGIIANCAVITTNPQSMVEKSNYEYFKNSNIARVAKNANMTALTVTELLLEDKERNKLLLAAKNYINNNNPKEQDKLNLLMEGKND